MRRPRLTLALATLALTAPAAHAADVTVARPAAPTTIDAGQGVALYSALDPATKQYRLMQLAAGGTTATVVPVPPSPEPFDADVGSTASGHAFYVYERCAKGDEASCDVYAFNPATGSEQRSKASDPAHGEHHATYWKGRLAFVREYGTSTKPKQVVYQRPDASSRRSTRLPGLPARRCDRSGCSAVTGSIDALELFGSRLAQTAFSTRQVSLGRGESYASDTAELRLVDVGSGRSQQLSARGSGESGQTWSAPSFDGGRLYASFSCFGDPSGCKVRNAGAYRYDYGAGSWALAGATTPLAGFAVGDGQTYELATNEAGGCGPVDGGAGADTSCALVRRDPGPSYAPVAAP